MKKAAIKSKPDIYMYHDYRVYLADMFIYLKTVRKQSIRNISEQVGVSHGYFTLVLQNSRSLGDKHLVSIGKVFELNVNDQKHFKDLITMSDNKSSKIRLSALQSISRKSNSQKNLPKEMETYEYLKNWYYVAIREMAQISDFKDDPAWIRKKLNFSVSLGEIRDALKFLKEKKLIEKIDDSWAPSSKVIRCVGGVFQILLRNFHLQMISLSATALERVDISRRKQIGYTTSLDKESFLKVKEVIEEAKEKIIKIEKECQSSSSVYHINFSAFPLTKE